MTLNRGPSPEGASPGRYDEDDRPTPVASHNLEHVPDVIKVTNPATAAKVNPAWPITTEVDPDRVYCANPVCGGVDVHPHYHRHPIPVALRKAIEGYQRDASTALASLRQYLDSGGAEPDWIHAFVSHAVAANANADKVKRELGW